LKSALGHLDVSPFGRRYLFFPPGVCTGPFAVHFDERITLQVVLGHHQIAVLQDLFLFSPGQTAGEQQKRGRAPEQFFPMITPERPADYSSAKG